MRHKYFFDVYKSAPSVCLLVVLSACVPASDNSVRSMAGEEDIVSDAVSDAAIGGGEEEQVAVAGAELDPVVCKRIGEIGTKIQKKTCMKKSQWDAQKGTGSELTSEWQRKGNLVGNPSGE